MYASIYAFVYPLSVHRERSLDLTLKDGTRKRVNLRPLLQGGKKVIVWLEELAPNKPRFPTPPWSQR